jgi:hypothetical protein
MPREITEGTGKLYASDGQRLIAGGRYQLWQNQVIKAKDESAGWEGQFFIDHSIEVPAVYVLGKEDGSRLDVTIEGGIYLWRPDRTEYAFPFKVVEVVPNEPQSK